MSWNNCKKCVIFARSTYTSALFKVLVTLKLLHGSRTGAKGSSLEDIAMFMIKHFCLDGDIKSQVLASLKYGVKMHFIQKRKEKFSLILPASSIHLAPCRYKNEETERIHCIFPPAWESNACNDDCSGEALCCGKRKRAVPKICCEDSDDESFQDNCNTCNPCQKPKRSKSTCQQPSRSRTNMSQHSCSSCFNQKKSKRKGAPCPKAKLPVCSRGGNRSKPLYDNYCQMCSFDENPDQHHGGYNYDAYKNCSCCSK